MIRVIKLYEQAHIQFQDSKSWRSAVVETRALFIFGIKTITFKVHTIDRIESVNTYAKYRRHK